MALVQKFMVVGTIVPLEERLDVAALRGSATSGGPPLCTVSTETGARFCVAPRGARLCTRDALRVLDAPGVCVHAALFRLASVKPDRSLLYTRLSARDHTVGRSMATQETTA